MFSLPAPVGGLNARDSIADMPPEDALVLDNFFPQPDYVELRRGHEEYASGMTNAVESLMEWGGPSSRKFFAANGTSIYEITSSGAVGTADVTSLTNARFQHAMMATSAGNFLVICNGADSVRHYNGTTWATPTITGGTSSTFINIAVHKRRLWFVQKDSTSAWYLGTDAIAGTATEFDFGPEFKLGGKLVAIGSMTRDGGGGPDDFACFISSLGEVAIYAGTDPDSADTWALVGVYYIPPPIGSRCVQKVGGDLAVITTGGVISLSAMMALERTAQDRAAVTAKINRLFMDDARSHSTNFGWQVLGYPNVNMVIVNIPVIEGTEQRQYVMNALTGAWCRFIGMEANCWCLFNDEIYFGGNDGKVYKADVGFQDDSGGILADLKGAFSYFGARGRRKRFTMMRPLFETNGRPGILMGLDVDFENNPPTAQPTPVIIAGTLWNTGKWDDGTWAGASGNVTKDWQGVTGIGTSAAVRLRVVSNGASVFVNGFDMMAEVGGPL